MSFIFKLSDSPNLIPVLGQGLQKYNSADDESIDPTNTIEVFSDEIWPSINKYFNQDVRMLDIGCGNGRFDAFLSNHVGHIVAIDAFREMNKVHCRQNIEFVKTTFQKYTGDPFDIIFLFGVFYLQESWGTASAFEKMISMLKDGGVIISVDDKKRDLRHDVSDRLPHGYYNLDSLCNRYGGEIIESFVQRNNVHRITVIKK
tara:strand:- start:1643 stop:2248 length:606 start_codon:yes stop_codon:yes gene_type:complete